MISVEENITVLVYEGAVSWCLELKKGGRIGWDSLKQSGNLNIESDTFTSEHVVCATNRNMNIDRFTKQHKKHQTSMGNIKTTVSTTSVVLMRSKLN